MDTSSQICLKINVIIDSPEIAIIDIDKVSDDFVENLANSLDSFNENTKNDENISRDDRTKEIKGMIENLISEASIYDDQVTLTLENTGSPARNYPYKAILPSGKIIYGKTDIQGRTQRLRESNSQHVIIQWGEEEKSEGE